MKRDIDLFGESVKRHRLHHAIVNFSQTQVTVGEETFRLMLDYLIIGLRKAGARRMARLPFPDASQEQKAGAIFTQASLIYPGTLESGSFLSLPEARTWLHPTVAVAM